jgi:hypothetical protein
LPGKTLAGCGARSKSRAPQPTGRLVCRGSDLAEQTSVDCSAVTPAAGYWPGARVADAARKLTLKKQFAFGMNGVKR